jgi:hypothetical protein
LVALFQVVRWKEKAAAAETMREAARKEKEYVQLQLNVKTEVRGLFRWPDFFHLSLHPDMD